MRTKICAHVQREEQSVRQTQRRERERGGGTRERVTAAAAAAAASAAAALLPKQSAYVGAYSNSHKARAGASERKRTQGDMGGKHYKDKNKHRSSVQREEQSVRQTQRRGGRHTQET